MKLKPGLRLFSAVCTTEFITVRAGADDVDVTIGGARAVLDPADRRPEAVAREDPDDGAQLGKRYVTPDGSVELLCTKGGANLPAVDGEVLMPKQTKPLPSSD